ncbi:MAG TPA: ABC transporter ATP-binding protein [Ilumatobacteraceae bacterium]|nr:ABC transporter ATP-binding protein [Ilumatobacteraceae bacterium]
MSIAAGEPDAAEVVDTNEQRKHATQARGFMGGRFGAAGMPVEKSKDFGASVRRLLGNLRPERAGAVFVVALAILSVAFYVTGPRVLGHATNIIFTGLLGPSHRIDFGDLHRVLFLVVLLYVVAAFLSWLQSWVLAGVVQRTMFRLRDEVEHKLERLPLKVVDGTPRGDLLSRVTNDIDNIAQSLQQTLSQLITSMLQIVGVLIMMLYVSWQLALFALITIPTSLFVIRFVSARSRSRFIAQWRYTGLLNAQVEEAFTGHTLVKVFGRQQQVEATFNAQNEELYKASFGAQFISGTIQPMMMFLGNLNYVAIAVIGGLRVSSGTMSIGDVQAFIQYSRQFTQPLTQMASMFNIFQSGVASAERVFEFLDFEEEIGDAGLEPVETVPVGRVEFEEVSFSYDPEKPLIQDLSLVAEPGRTVAIVGPTGAGKTTLVNLLMRFYELDGGRILLDGRDIASMTRHDLRANIGMVLQDTWLFSGTIRENIAYGNLEATEAEILAAAKAAYVDRFVHALPDGYDTLLDEDGTSLSAGEKQLMTIARAFLSDPAILILDEATSSVDTRTEVLIQHAMAQLRSSRTSFVIAHRLSTIRDADTILVMDHGRIVEQGSHEQLLAAGGAYYNLYHAQFASAVTDLV